nr:reverse transcriptase domain-containing protein [Tanacetum cinerariifolium]
RTKRSYFPPANKIPRHSRRKTTNVVECEIRTNVTMADNRTMAQMLQVPIEGYEDAIVVPQINANNFELKQTIINLVQSNQFTERQDPYNHLRFFNKVTSTFRHPEVLNTTIKLLVFPFSLEGEARIWLDKEPPRLILTWEDLVSKFINQFFPPSKTTYLRNEITNFLQKPNETFNEAWEHLKDLLRQCPHHGSQSYISWIPSTTHLTRMIRMHSIQQPEGISWIRFPANVYQSLKIAASLEDKLDIRINRFEKSLNDMKNSFITPTAPLKVVEEGGITVVKNEENELIPTRLVTGWRVCIDYQKLNDATPKDHFPLPFMDQMLESLAGNEYYCFLDGFLGSTTLSSYGGRGGDDGSSLTRKASVFSRIKSLSPKGVRVGEEVETIGSVDGVELPLVENPRTS